MDSRSLGFCALALILAASCSKGEGSLDDRSPPGKDGYGGDLGGSPSGDGSGDGDGDAPHTPGDGDSGDSAGEGDGDGDSGGRGGDGSGGADGTGGSDGSGGAPPTKKVCTAEPVITFGGNYYGSDGILTRTMPVAWRIDTETEEPERITVASSQAELYGIEFAQVQQQASGPLLLLGREHAQTRNACYKNTFLWNGPSDYEKLIFDAGDHFETDEMVPYIVGALTLVDDEPYLGLTLRSAKINPQPTEQCLGSTTTIPAVYRPESDELTVYEYEASTQLHDLVEVNGTIFASGTSFPSFLYWESGDLHELPSEEAASGRTFIDRSQGQWYVAGLAGPARSRRLTLWKNGELYDAQETPSANGLQLVDMSAEDGHVYTLMQDNDTLFYLRDGKDPTTLDMSDFDSCTPTDIQAFDGHIYVLSGCVTEEKVRSQVFWIDGSRSALTFTPELATVQTDYAGMTVGCATSDGFSSKLD